MSEIPSVCIDKIHINACSRKCGFLDLVHVIWLEHPYLAIRVAIQAIIFGRSAGVPCGHAAEDLHLVLCAGLHRVNLVVLLVFGVAFTAGTASFPEGGCLATADRSGAPGIAAEPPDADGDDDVARCDDNERHEEHRKEEKHHVKFFSDLRTKSNGKQR